MKPTVHILACCRNRALLDATLLVFKTVRVAFPCAPVRVWANGLELPAWQEVERSAQRAGAQVVTLKEGTSHDAWLERLLAMETRPFFALDTDVVFFPVAGQPPAEDWFAADGETGFAGRFEPEFFEESTGTRHMARLHPCVSYFHPARLRPHMDHWMRQFPRLWAHAQTNLVRQAFVPMRGERPLFYDTLAGLWQAGLGTPFSEEQNAAFGHLACGSYSDLMVRYEGLADMAAVHKRVMAEPDLARDLLARQRAYYNARSLTAKAAKSPNKRIQTLVVNRNSAHAEASACAR